VARVLIASKDNEQAAQSLGISLYRARLTAFAISGCIAAVAGVVLAYEQRGLHLASFGAAVSVQVFLLAIIGGLGALSGPILGALYQGGLQVLAATPFAPIAGVLLSPGVGVVVLLIAMPGGLAQGLFGLRDAWLRRVASRNRIDVPSLVADKARSEGEPFRLAPKLRPTGAPEFVPVRYRTEGQWMVEKMVDELRTSGKASRPRAVRHV
jgi:branched-chain amino acid transport system permease protein